MYPDYGLSEPESPEIIVPQEIILKKKSRSVSGTFKRGASMVGST